ncbi:MULTISPECIES: glycosyltransferase [Kitasatospora]|uniref:glycosyltransferase n=1 Tax=Kitasatospora TaxID=2063 RepID=UPI0006876B00|nr:MULTISPECIES: glycosyltransferase [Kitasatospora]
MPLISVITPVHPDKHAFLSETWASVRRQALPPGWEWEWLVQQDGPDRPDGSVWDVLPRDPRIRTGSARAGGAGVARTMALARARGTLVRALDADDLLLPGALHRDVTALHRTGAAWCVSACLDLLPDGTLRPGPWDPPDGPLELAALRQRFEAGAFPLVGTHLTARTDLVRALGGWPAYPALEALAMVLFCAALAPGVMIAQPGGIYRKHPGMTTSEPSYHHETDFDALRRSILTRLDSPARAGFSWLPRQPGAPNPTPPEDRADPGPRRPGR